MVQADHSGVLQQAQDLNKRVLEGVQIPALEPTDVSLVRLLDGAEHPEGSILVVGSLELAGSVDSHALGLDQQERQPLCGGFA